MAYLKLCVKRIEQQNVTIPVKSIHASALSMLAIPLFSSINATNNMKLRVINKLRMEIFIAGMAALIVKCTPKSINRLGMRRNQGAAL
jgi:hypothetical protein